MLSEKEFEKLALLARLDASDETLCGIREEFNTIVQYVDKVKELTLDQNETSAGKKPTKNTSKDVIPVSYLRDDQPKQISINDKDIEAIAPQWEAGHFVVPGVIQPEV